MDKQGLRTISMQIVATDNSEVVKLAGLWRRFKNWWKAFRSSEYKDQVDSLRSENKEAVELAKKLDDHIKEMTSAIKDGDVVSYNDAANNAKKLMIELTNIISKTNKDVNVLFRDVFERMQASKTLSSFQFAEDDVKWNNRYEGRALKSFDWYKDVPDSLHMSEKVIINIIGSTIKKTKIDKEILDSNKDEFIQNFQEAVINGNLLWKQHREPAKSGEMAGKTKKGEAEIVVESDTVKLPNGSVVKYVVRLLDTAKPYLGGRRPNNLSVRKLENIISVSAPKQETVPLEPEPVKPSEEDILQELSEQENTRIEKELSKENKALLYKAFLKQGLATQRVPKFVTKLNDKQFAEIMRKGFVSAFGRDPTLEELAGGWAQGVLESGRSPTLLPGNNVGNIKATSGWINSGGLYFTMDAGEFDQSGNFYKVMGDKFRAYEAPEEGAAHYWKLIGNDRYKQALKWMAAGKPQNASVVLGVQGYYTANIAKYSDSVSKLYGTFVNDIAPQMPGLKSAPIEMPDKQLPVKNFSSEYTKEEKEMLVGGEDKLNTGKPNTDEVENLTSKLFESYGGTLTNFVKKALLQNNLPDNNYLIFIKGNDYSHKLEYVRALSNILRRSIGAKSTISSDGRNINLECNVYGSSDKAERVLKTICEMASYEFKRLTKIAIVATPVKDLYSKYAEVDSEEIVKNLRTFYLQRRI